MPLRSNTLLCLRSVLYGLLCEPAQRALANLAKRLRGTIVLPFVFILLLLLKIYYTTNLIYCQVINTDMSKYSTLLYKFYHWLAADYGDDFVHLASMIRDEGNLVPQMYRDCPDFTVAVEY
jgi:hypothetical protein